MPYYITEAHQNANTSRFFQLQGALSANSPEQTFAKSPTYIFLICSKASTPAQGLIISSRHCKII